MRGFQCPESQASQARQCLSEYPRLETPRVNRGVTAGEYTSARQALDSIAKQHGLAGDSHSTVDVRHSGAIEHLQSVSLEKLEELLFAIDQRSTTLAIEAPENSDA